MVPQQVSRRRRSLDPTVGLFVSLYLILLAFFIVMNHISNQQTARAVAAMESLERAFERPFPEPAKTPGLAPPQAHPASDPAFLQEAGELVSSLLGSPQATATKGGNLLQIQLDTHALFFSNAARLSEQAAPFLEEVAGLLSTSSEGMRREVVFLFGRSGEEGGLAASRAERLAVALEEAGAPVSGVSIGLLPTRSGREMRLDFRAAPLALSQLRLVAKENES